MSPQFAGTPQKIYGILLCLRLEGDAKSFSGALRIVRSDCDLACRAVGVAVMIIAVLHIALDPLDVLAAATLILILIFHDCFVPPFLFLRKSHLSQHLVFHDMRTAITEKE